MVAGTTLAHATKRAKTAIGSAALFIALAVSASCTDDDPSLSERPEGGAESASPCRSDASAPEVSVGSVEMCDTTECPDGRMTCPGDRYACAADLQSDDFNCGACGNACPGAGSPVDELHTKWSCIDGRCMMRCDTPWADCNGVVDDGCEVDLTRDKQNCGACGAECPWCVLGKCDCSHINPDYFRCGASCVRSFTNDDGHCGECDHPCDLRFLDPSWHAYLGCGHGRCDQRKCLSDYGDCNGDLGRDDGDGCETPDLGSDPNNCGDCGVQCKGNERCIGGRCFACKEGQVLCELSMGSIFECATLTMDLNNCGACGYVCPGVIGTKAGAFMTPTCVEGVCGFACEDDRGDCDGTLDNGCEVDLRVDPDNCGGCGRRCPLPGQACVEGRCAQVPCGSEVIR